GNDFNAVISGGVQDVFGATTGTLLLGGSQFVEAGAVASATVLDAGASQFLFGTASGTVISAGDLAVVEPGGTAVNPTIAGGTLELTPSTLATGNISFAGTGGALGLGGSSLAR